jgi:hypothetical protein
MVTITVLPIHALCCATKIFDRSRGMNANNPIQNIDVKFLACHKPEIVTDFLRDYDLKFR